MNLGSLTERITLQQAAPTRNGYGEELPGWSAPETVWAKVDYRNGSEVTTNAQQQAVQQVRFLIRYRPDALTTTFRVTYEGRAYDIEAVAPVGRKSGLLLTATTRA